MKLMNILITTFLLIGILISFSGCTPQDLENEDGEPVVSDEDFNEIVFEEEILDSEFISEENDVELGELI